MSGTRSKAPAIGSSQWILDERSQANDLVTQEVEDFGFSVRNELEWLNEHMMDIFAYDGQNNLDVYKTPGKLRGKTPRTARKKNAEPRQPLGDIFTANAQNKPSPAQRSLQNNLQNNLTKARFQIAEDTENAAFAQTPVQSPVPRPLFAKPVGTGKENQDSGYHAAASDDVSEHAALSFPMPPTRWSPQPSTQDTAVTEEDTQIFSQAGTQSTQPTQAFPSMRRSIGHSEEERRDTGESFVSAKEAFASNNASKENLRDEYHEDAMDVDTDKADKTTESDAPVTIIHHEASSIHDTTIIHHPEPSSPHRPEPSSPPHPRVSEQYSVSAETQEALDTAAHINRVLTQAPTKPIFPSEQYSISAETHAALDSAAIQDDTVLHHDIEDQMNIDDDVRSPSDGSSPVKPLVRKSSLTFASLPAREPLIAKKSMGNRVSRTSHVDANKARNSYLGRFTGGKSLGGSQHAHATESRDDDDDDDTEVEADTERPQLGRLESETTKLHNKTSTQRLADRINMLKQKNEPPKNINQHMSSQTSQAQSLASSQASQPAQPPQPAQPTYPQLPAGEPETAAEDDDDDWISPIRTAPQAANPIRPILSKSHSADTRPAFINGPILPKPISVSNPDRSTVVASTTPAGSPTALRAAKEKIIGSSATSAQVKLDALAEGPARPHLQTHSSSDDVFSPKRNEKAGTSLFAHLRSPSKESLKSTKSTKICAMPGSPSKDDGRRTRSSSERERMREKESQEKEMKQQKRAEDKLNELRQKEQSKAAAHYEKTKAATAATKTPVAAPQQHGRPAPAPALSAAKRTPQTNPQPSVSRPGPSRANTAPRNQEQDSGEEMPPPPPPKSLLPTGTGHKLREPKRLVKTASKDTLPKAKPQAIKVNLHRFGQGPLAAPKPGPPAAATKPAPAQAAASRPPPPPAKSTPAAASKPAPRVAPAAAKPAPRMGRPQQTKVAEKPKPVPAPAPAQPRADLGAARPVSRMQTVQDANRINVPPINPAKPAKRPFQPENDEPLHRPAKRPSQLQKSKPVPATPAHAQFAQGKIPFAESSAPPTIQYPNGEDIKLPEIMTDSEDEDSENEFEQPSWVNTPNLQEMLKTQQLMDPEQIFGPIAPLNMEQVFPNKERHKRFRERTSSAYWSHDQVTEEEKRKEKEARERLAREGAWSYHPSPGPSSLSNMH